MYNHVLAAYGSFQSREIVISSPTSPLSAIQSSNKYVSSIRNAQGFIRGRHEHDIVLDLVDKQTTGLKRKKKSFLLIQSSMAGWGGDTEEAQVDMVFSNSDATRSEES